VTFEGHFRYRTVNGFIVYISNIQHMILYELN